MGFSPLDVLITFQVLSRAVFISAGAKGEQLVGWDSAEFTPVEMGVPLACREQPVAEAGSPI